MVCGRIISSGIAEYCAGPVWLHIWKIYFSCNVAAQVLRLLSQEFLINGQALHALACMKHLRELQDPIADHPSLCLTAIEALIQVALPLRFTTCCKMYNTYTA